MTLPVDALTLTAAFVSGLLGSVHCAAMCGGIATGFSALSTRHGWLAALEPNLGRIGGYVLAGALAGGLGHGIVSVARIDGLATGLRMLVGAVLIWVSMRMMAPKIQGIGDAGGERTAANDVFDLGL